MNLTIHGEVCESLCFQHTLNIKIVDIIGVRRTRLKNFLMIHNLWSSDSDEVIEVCEIIVKC